MFETMRRDSIIRLVIFLLVFIGSVAIVHKIILGKYKLVRLSSAPALSGQISQTLGPKPNGSMQVYGKDYTFTPHYFSEPGWAVANIKPISNNLQGSFVVMKKSNGIFQVVIGPGTSMSVTQLSSLPPDVAGYLNAHVAVFTPIIGQ